MPYEVRKKGAQFCVYKEGSSDSLGCHDSKSKAQAQQRALYANERNQKAAMDDARTFSAKERKQAAGKGQAMSGGGFPIKNEQDLRNAIQAYGRAGNKAAAKAHIIRRAKALGKTSLLPKGWLAKKSDSATEWITCSDEACERLFLTEMGMFEHAEAVHTFDDIRRMVAEAVREKWGRKGDYRADPPIPSIWAWVVDLANDWVVFEVDKDDDSTLYKASYSITDDSVTFGNAVEVRRRTVYEPLGGGD